MTKILMCDPPMGWKYGFPKPMPDLYYEMGENFELEMWLVSEGYPQEELFRLAHVGCRYWEKEDDTNNS